MNNEQAFQESCTAPVSSQEDETHLNKDEAEPDDVSVTASMQCPSARAGRKPRNPAVLVLWLKQHSGYPYPTREEKSSLAYFAGMTRRQLDCWFANTRRTIKKVGYDTWEKKHSAFSAVFLVTDLGKSKRETASQSREVAGNPAAIYCLSSLNMNQPNVTISSSSESGPCSLQTQFNPSSISIISLNNYSACEATNPITSDKTSPEVNIERPILCETDLT